MLEEMLAGAWELVGGLSIIQDTAVLDAPKVDRRMSLTSSKEFLSLLETYCHRCNSRFEIFWPSPPVGISWCAFRPPRFCDTCKPAYVEARLRTHLTELSREFESGFLSLHYRGQNLKVQEVEEFFQNPVERVDKLLTSADIIAIPADWWHSHYASVVITLREEGWPYVPYSSVFRVSKCGMLSPWFLDRSTLPEEALVDLLSLGEAKPVIDAFEGNSRVRNDRSTICEMAKRQLNAPELKLRFAAVYVLLILASSSSCQIFLDIATNLEEHPRIRGAALQGIAESFSSMTKVQANGALKAMKRSAFDSEPEVRWWAAYAIGHFDAPCFSPEGKLKNNLQAPLVSALESLVDDSVPAGLGWSIGKEAKDSITLWDGNDPPERPMFLPFDPWGCV